MNPLLTWPEKVSPHLGYYQKGIITVQVAIWLSERYDRDLTWLAENRAILTISQHCGTFVEVGKIKFHLA
jgi:hypothetical protein